MAVTAAILPSTVARSATDATVSSLELNVSGLRNKKGNILICLTRNSKAFPDCSKDPNSQKRTVSATAATGLMFSDLQDGQYALSLIHDENGNGKLDKAVLIPKEGFGFSRNPTITFGPPKFKSAAFAVSGNVVQSVKMKYMF